MLRRNSGVAHRILGRILAAGKVNDHPHPVQTVRKRCRRDGHAQILRLEPRIVRSEIPRHPVRAGLGHRFAHIRTRLQRAVAAGVRRLQLDLEGFSRRRLADVEVHVHMAVPWPALMRRDVRDRERLRHARKRHRRKENRCFRLHAHILPHSHSGETATRKPIPLSRVPVSPRLP